MNEFKLQARFGDKRIPRTYLSPDIRSKDPGWGSEEFNRLIEELIFFLPGKRLIVMAGMEKYNFFIEGIQKLNGRSGVGLESIIIAGKVFGLNEVRMWKITRTKVLFKTSEFGKEYYGTPTRGWKPGVPGKAHTQLVRLQNG